MSTSRCSSTARFSPRAFCASSKSTVVRSIWSDRPLIWRSSSFTMRFVVSFCRSMFASSSEIECAWVRSRSSSCSTSERSRRMVSSRCWLSRSCWSKGAGRCAASGAAARTAQSATRPEGESGWLALTRRAARAGSHAPQMAAHRRGTAEQPDQGAEPDDRERLQPREEGGVDEPAVDEEVCPERQPDGDQPTQHALDRALQEKRAPDEPIGGAYEPHDGDLAAALQHGHPDRGADDDDRHHRERRADHETNGRGNLAQPIELLHPVAPEPHVVHEPEAAQPVGDLVHVLCVAKPGLELHLD